MIPFVSAGKLSPRSCLHPHTRNRAISSATGRTPGRECARMVLMEGSAKRSFLAVRFIDRATKNSLNRFARVVEECCGLESIKLWPVPERPVVITPGLSSGHGILQKEPYKSAVEHVTSHDISKSRPFGICYVLPVMTLVHDVAKVVHTH